MPSRWARFAALAIVVGFASEVPTEAGAQTAATKRLPAAGIRFEQNATDGDVEVVFEITGPDNGLTRLSVIAPDGRTVVDFTAPNATKYGIREFLFESPEPKDVVSLKAAYPAGEYTFQGATADGVHFGGTAKLNHELPPTVAFQHPAANAQGVDPKNLEITWTPVESAVGYVIEIEQPRLDINVVVKQPASQAKFAVPNGLLVPGMKYTLGIGTVSKDGNLSFVETHFTTAAGN